MKLDHVYKITNPSVADLISSIVISKGREYVPLSPTPRVYIEPDELMRKHDERVEFELMLWERANLE